MSEFVRIQSTKTIKVTCGLDFQDFTNYESDIANRMKVSPSWPKAMILIREGVGNYPKDILEWPTVQALVKDNILTIGQEVEEHDEQKVHEAEELKMNLEEIKPKKSRKSRKKLEEIADETAEEQAEEKVEE